MKNVFYFDFYDEENEVSTMYAFTVDELDFNELQQSVEFEDQVCDIEDRFGVHDWSTSPADDVAAIGYTSYEIGCELHIVMAKWRDYFSSLGGTVSNVVMVPRDVANGNDAVIYDYVKSVHRLCKVRM